MSKDTLFTNDSGGGASSGSGQYVQDVFRDVTLPANSNSGLTDSATTNPIGAKVGNADVPRFGTKTLWVKDLVLIQDRSKWINGAVTYQVIWNEDFPAVAGYFQPLGQSVQPSVNLRRTTVNGLMGVVCKARKVGFLVQGASSSGSRIYVDGANSGQAYPSSTASSGGTTADQAQYNFQVSAATNASDDLHDFRGDLIFGCVFEGVIVYFENTTGEIANGPGTTYNNKTAATTTVESNTFLPSFGSSLGGVSVVNKSQGAAYSLISVDARTKVSIGQGTNGSAILNVSTGHGASFPAGSGVVVHQGGGSFYVGGVQSVSTDALTVSPLLPFGISNTVYRSWLSSPSLSIGASYMELFQSIRFSTYLIGGITQLPIFDPTGNWAIWGTNVGFSTPIAGKDFLSIGGASGFIQVQGMFSAAEVEFSNIANAAFAATFSVNGVPGFSVNTDLFGEDSITNYQAVPFKQTVFTEAGGGWNGFKMGIGLTMPTGSWGVAKINLYRRRNDGASFGNLASIEKLQEFGDRPLASDVMALGTGRRVYSDQMLFQGGLSCWIRQSNEISAAGIRYVGSTTTCVFTQRFYGQNFALIGTAPTGATLTLDGVGVPLASAFNRMAIGATEMFHTVTYAHRSGTSIIEAFDFSRSFGEERWIGTSSPIIIPIASTVKSNPAVLYASGGTATLSGSFSNVTFTAINSFGFSFSGVTLVIPSSGWYKFNTQASFSSTGSFTAGSALGVQISVNGTPVKTALESAFITNDDVYIPVTYQNSFNAGDVITIQAKNSVANPSWGSGTPPDLEVTKLLDIPVIL